MVADERAFCRDSEGRRATNFISRTAFQIFIKLGWKWWSHGMDVFSFVVHRILLLLALKQQRNKQRIEWPTFDLLLGAVQTWYGTRHQKFEDGHDGFWLVDAYYGMAIKSPTSDKRALCVFSCPALRLISPYRWNREEGVVWAIWLPSVTPFVRSLTSETTYGMWIHIRLECRVPKVGHCDPN